MWLNPEKFEALDFSPDQAVAELRRYVSSSQLTRITSWQSASGHYSLCSLLQQVPLPTVKRELQTYLLHLKNKVRSSKSYSHQVSRARADWVC